MDCVAKTHQPTSTKSKPFHLIESQPDLHLARCGTCHLVQAARAVSSRESLHCTRCGSRLGNYHPWRLSLARALALAALVLYLPANLLPIALVSHQGSHLTFTIVQGIRNLFANGHIFVAILVLCTSFLTPILKILGLLFVGFAPAGEWLLRRRRQIYDLIKVLNPWNSMEIFLLATLLTLVSFGKLAAIRGGPGALAFAGVVVLTTAATVVFDPSDLWRRTASKNEPQNGS